MAMRSIEVERRFPVENAVFEQVDKNLQRVKIYENIIDTYYIFDLLNRNMVRARSVEQTSPQKEKKFQLCAKKLFSPVDELTFELSEINVKVDDFEKLKTIFELIKKEEFTIRGNRRYYRIPTYSGQFPTLTITTDYVENLCHKNWVEIEILLDEVEATQMNYSKAISEICMVAQKGFGMMRDYIQTSVVFPTYPETHFWERWYREDWCKTHGEVCRGFNYKQLEEI